MCSCLSGGRRMQQNKRFEQSPDSNVSINGNLGFYVYVWPLRAGLPPGTAQLKRSVRLHQVLYSFALYRSFPGPDSVLPAPILDMNQSVVVFLAGGRVRSRFSVCACDCLRRPSPPRTRLYRSLPGQSRSGQTPGSLDEVTSISR